MPPRGAPGQPKSPEHRAKIGAGVKKARAEARAKLKSHARQLRGLMDDVGWLLEANASPEGLDVEQVSTILVSALEQIAEGLQLTIAVYEIARTTGVGGDQIPDPPSNGKGRPFERLSMDKLGRWKAAGIITQEAHDAEVAARKPSVEARRDVPKPPPGAGGWWDYGKQAARQQGDDD